MNKIFLDLGIFTITWYALIIVSAMVLGLFLSKKELKYHKLNSELFMDYVFYLIIFAFLGARMWYVLFEWTYFSSNIVEILKIYNGGLAIHGGILGGLLYTTYFSRKFGIKLFTLTDICVTALILGQSIGRWGNFFNQEAHGGETSRQFLEGLLLPEFIINGMNIDGVYYHPTFLYESIFNFVGFLIIILVLRPRFRNSYGILTGFYLVWYGFIRFFIEIMRTDALTLGVIKVAQFTSFMMFVAGIIILVVSVRRRNE